MKKILSKDGTPLAFDQSGTGPAVLLVGGAFQYRAVDSGTAKLAALLSPHSTVLHYDRRGRGNSGDTLPYAIEREIEDIDALIQEVGGSASVFGMSSGAVLALRAAAAGLAIKKLALYEPPFNSGSDEDLQMSANYTRQLTTLLKEGRRGDAAAFARQYFGTPAEMVAGMRQMPMWPLFEAVAPTLAYDNAIMGDGSVPAELLANVMTPTLVMDGEASPAFMHKAAQAAAHYLPNARHRRLPEQTHNVDPEVLAPVLEEFFAG
jgi:pimeloyl-ACP methyl ester carboxylesterase